VTLALIVQRLEDILETVEGVTRAFGRPPQALNTGDLPALVVRWLRSDINESEPYQTGRRLDHHFVVRIYGAPGGQDVDAATRQERLEPYLERVLDRLSAAVLLDGLDSTRYNLSDTMSARLTEIGDYPVIEIELTVTEKYVITVGT